MVNNKVDLDDDSRRVEQKCDAAHHQNKKPSIGESMFSLLSSSCNLQDLANSWVEREVTQSRDDVAQSLSCLFQETHGRLLLFFVVLFHNN